MFFIVLPRALPCVHTCASPLPNAFGVSLFKARQLPLGQFDSGVPIAVVSKMFRPYLSEGSIEPSPQPCFFARRGSA